MTFKLPMREWRLLNRIKLAKRSAHFEWAKQLEHELGKLRKRNGKG